MRIVLPGPGPVKSADGHYSVPQCATIRSRLLPQNPLFFYSISPQSEVHNFREGCSRNTRKSLPERIRGKKQVDMKSIKISVALLGLATLLFACPNSVSCPADHAEMHEVSEDSSGSVRLVIYAHQTSAGETHQVTVRCEK